MQLIYRYIVLKWKRIKLFTKKPYNLTDMHDKKSLSRVQISRGKTFDKCSWDLSKLIEVPLGENGVLKYWDCLLL